MTSLRSFIPLVVACLTVAGCTIVKMQQGYDQSIASTVIVGRVHGQFSGTAPIVVAACPVGGVDKVSAHTVLHGAGEYELAVYRGDYYVFVFEDINRNLIYDAGEPAGQHGHPKRVHVPSVGVVFDIDVVIPSSQNKIAVSPGTRIASPGPASFYSRQAGAIADLDDPRFCEENGKKGFWDYGSFYAELGGNVYFLEAYDPHKIPILFIHGAAGTPRDWRHLVRHIDRNRYQPWFFYYPSGARIDSMAYLLLWKLANLQTKYKFNTLYITAHSMGGLVARSLLVNHGPQLPCVKLLICLATPWGGDHMAELGVRQSPALISSWIDMQPEGDFIKSLYRKKLPASVRFFMFSGYKGSRNPFRSNNDGTITLSSILDQRPQAEAEMNYVFNEDHASILSSDEVAAQYNAVLDQFDAQQSGPGQAAGGYLRINFSYTYDHDGIRPQPILVLVPEDGKNAEIITLLSNKDNGRVLGPFPAGRYVVAMAAMAAKPRANLIPVEIEKDQTKALDFVFVPDGELYGCVTAALDPDDKYIGRPDYTYRSVDEKIRIRSIRLKGNGTYRSLVPRVGKPVENTSLISRKDYCYNKCFGFFGLPAGEYTLYLEARGYQPVAKKYSVTPGKPRYFRVTELAAIPDAAP